MAKNFQFGINAQSWNGYMRKLSRLAVLYPKYTRNVSKGLAKFIERSAKARAPRFMGTLKRSIKARAKGPSSITITADAPWAAYQEFPYTPHWVSPYSSKTKNRLKLQAWWMSKKGTMPPAVIFVKGYKPFMAPAVNAGVARAPQLFSRESNKAFRDSGFKRVK